MGELIDRLDLESWLKEQKYADRTVQDTVMAADGLLAKCVLRGELPPVTSWARARRLVRYAEERGLPWAGNEVLLAAAGNDAARESERQVRKRKLEAKSFDDAGWQRLAQAIFADESRAARVLEIVMLSGLRVADALRIEIPQAREGLETMRLETIQKGNLPRTLVLAGQEDPLWQAVARLIAAVDASSAEEKPPKVLYLWIVPGSGARLPIDSARKACYERLLAIGKRVGLKGRVHLHRMRRTVAVQALRSGADLPAVGQLLGHRPGSSATYAYVDEARLDDVASVRRKINERFIKKGEKT